MSVEYEAIGKHSAELDDPGRGKHLWTVFAMFRVINPSEAIATAIHMDMENLMTIEGPGCFKCEAVWSPAIEKRWCNGTMK